MITTLVCIVTAVVLWHVLTARLLRSASACVQSAVLATTQALELNGELSDEQRDQARVQTALFSLALLGRWRTLHLRLALCRWDLSTWLDAQIEFAIHVLKSSEQLPVSTRTAMSQNVTLQWADQLVRALLPLLVTKKSQQGNDVKDRATEPVNGTKHHGEPVNGVKLGVTTP